MRRLLVVLRVLATLVVGVGAMGVLMVWLAGGFHEKIQPKNARPLPPPVAGLPTVAVEARLVPAFRDAVGTVAAEHETAVASLLLGRVREVKVSAGDEVKAGDVLVSFEKAEHQARLDQANAALRSAEDDLRRLEKLAAGHSAVVTEQEVAQARARVDGARAKRTEAATVLSYATVKAPSAGVVIDRYIEVGDTVQPGQTLIRLYDRLQLVATVPESLQSRLKVGQAIGVRLDALGLECEGQVAEIVPQSSRARAFEVKVTGPCSKGVMPGMFGRIRIPLEPRREIRIPVAAVRRVGQIAMVFLVQPSGHALRQFVRLGRETGDAVVVRSGLTAGDRIVADASRVYPEERAR